MADHLHLAFLADGSEQVAGVCLRVNFDMTLLSTWRGYRLDTGRASDTDSNHRVVVAHG